jgi:hypothetical protein
VINTFYSNYLYMHLKIGVLYKNIFLLINKIMYQKNCTFLRYKRGLYIFGKNWVYVGINTVVIWDIIIS